MTNETPQLLPAYLIVGEDHLKRDRAISRMKMRLEKLGDLSFNSDTFDGATAEGAAIVSACETMPFASEKRLVVVNDAEKLAKASQTQVAGYIKDPSETTVLVLVADKLAKTTSLYKAVASVGDKSVIDCTPPRKKDLPSQARAMATSHGITLTPAAAQALVDLVGEDTVHIDEELKKLAVSYPGVDAVTDAQVKELVAQVAEAKPWDLVDAFAARNMKQALRYLSLMPSASPFALLRQCVTRVRELVCAQCAIADSSNPKATLVQELGQPDWKWKNHLTWARNYTPKELRCALESSLDCERKMKGGTAPDAAFKEWLVGVMAR